MIAPELVMPPLKVEIVTAALLLVPPVPILCRRRGCPRCLGRNRATVADAAAKARDRHRRNVGTAAEDDASPPTQMPLPPAEIAPELVMPPPKVPIVTDAVLERPETRTASPPTQMPAAAAEIAPELVMPPPKLEIVSDIVCLVAQMISASTPSKIPGPEAAEIVPEFTMLPAKVDSVKFDPVKLPTKFSQSRRPRFRQDRP